MRGLFVTGTGTGVGKTIVSAALLATIRDTGQPVRAYKPVITGLAEATGAWPPDHELLAAAAGMNPGDVTSLRFEPAVSPHLAASLAGEPIEPRRLVEQAYRTGGTSETSDESSKTQMPVLVVEGVGGLLVPLTDHFTVCDLAVALSLPLVIAATPGLGTINHTLLTLQVARSAGLDVRAVVLTPWPGAPSAMESSNRQTIAQLGHVRVDVLPRLAGPTQAELVRAGAQLPWQDWLGA